MDKTLAAMLESAGRHSRRVANEPFAGADRTGMPEGQELPRAERRSWLSIGPRRRRAGKLEELDAGVADLQNQLTETRARLTDLLERQRSAPERDAERLAEWHLQGARGSRPTPEVDSLADAVRAAERDQEALQLAVDGRLEGRARWVELNRAKLVADAGKETEIARARYAAAITELEAARGELVTTRLDELWTMLFPSEMAATQPLHMASLARALEARLVRANVATRVESDQLFRLLHEDVEALATAISPEQQATLGVAKPNGEAAGWEDDPDQVDAREHARREAALREAREMEAASRRYRQKLGIES